MLEYLRETLLSIVGLGIIGWAIGLGFSIRRKKTP